MNDITTYTYDGIQIEIRPTQQGVNTIQINVRNPEDYGHSVATFYSCSSDVSTIDDVFSEMSTVGFIKELITKARPIFVDYMTNK